MPQIIVRYDQDQVRMAVLVRFRNDIMALVADVASTKRVPLSPKQVEWIPEPLHPGAMAPSLSFEIRTIGYSDRKAKMNREAMLELKSKILRLHGFRQYFERINPDDPLIWVQFLDPDGVHV